MEGRMGGKGGHQWGEDRREGQRVSCNGEKQHLDLQGTLCTPSTPSTFKPFLSVLAKPAVHTGAAVFSVYKS